MKVHLRFSRSMAREFMPRQAGQIACTNLECVFWDTSVKSFTLFMDSEYAPDLTVPRATELRDMIQTRLRERRPMNGNIRAALQKRLLALNIFLGVSIVDEIGLLEGS